MTKMIRKGIFDGALHVDAAGKDLVIDGKALVHNDARFAGFNERMMNSPLRSMLQGHMDGIATGSRFDAASSYALARELQYVSAVIAQEPLADLTSMMAFPMAVDQPAPYQQVYTWKAQTWTKSGRISRNYKDIGVRGDIQISQNSQNVAPLLAHASWGLDDIARAALGNVPLPALELQGAMRTVSESINSEVWFGDSDAGIEGLYSNGDIVKSVVATGGAGSPLWANKTPDEIEADIVTMISAVVEAVKGKGSLLPNRIALSVASYMKLATTARSQLTGMTILQFAEQALASAGAPNPQITAHPELADNGSGAKFMVCYRHDPLVAGRILPVAPVFLPPDIESTYITQAIHAQSGGINIRYPVAMQIRYGM
jgi:hypothetical protein